MGWEAIVMSYIERIKTIRGCGAAGIMSEARCLKKYRTRMQLQFSAYSKRLNHGKMKA